jgi:hypothetical protein
MSSIRVLARSAIAAVTAGWIAWAGTALLSALLGAGITLWAVWSQFDNLRAAAVTEYRFAILADAVTTYGIAFSEYPPELANLVATGDIGPEAGDRQFRRFVPEVIPVDAHGNVLDGWGRPIRFRLLDCGTDGPMLQLLSDGRNRTPDDGASDDLVRLMPIERARQEKVRARRS